MIPDFSSFDPFRPPLDADDLALNECFSETVSHGWIVTIFWTQFDMIVMQEEALDRRFLTPDERHHDFPVSGVLTRLTNCQIAV